MERIETREAGNLRELEVSLVVSATNLHYGCFQNPNLKPLIPEKAAANFDSSSRFGPYTRHRTRYWKFKIGDSGIQARSGSLPFVSFDAGLRLMSGSGPCLDLRDR